MKLTKNFTKEEFERSATAEKYKIDNTIPPKYYDYLIALCEQLQTIRNEWGEPIIISSGYRCKELNKKVGGASNSDHVYSCAVDIHTKENTKEKNKELFNLIIALKDMGKLHLRQIIDEYNYKWLHISINNEFNTYKNNQVLHIK